MSTFDAAKSRSRPPSGGSCLPDTPAARLRLAAMTTMATTLAHEVNQPLTSAANYIHASARRLRKHGEGFEEVLAMIEQAGHETVRAGEIIRRMRNFIVSGKIAGRRENLGMMIDKVATGLICPDGADVEIVKAMQPGASFVIADRIQIEQVLSNILKYACEALKGRCLRRVTIGAIRAGEEVIVQIEDSGPGLSGYAVARLFDPLLATNAGAIGLGLPISKTIVEAHGGKLWAESPAGGGARFSLSLPAAD